MATIIDTTFFYPPLLEIPQIDTPAVAATVQRYIDLYEPEYLALLLGDTLPVGLYAEELTEAAAKLLNGGTYTDGFGLEQFWPGLRYTRGTVKCSPIANYVYCKYIEQQVASVTTGTGEKVGKAQNAADATPKYKVVRAWNDMVHQNWLIVRYLTARPDYYPAYVKPALSLANRRLFSPVNMYL